MINQSQNIGDYSYSRRKSTPIRIVRYIYRRFVHLFYKTTSDYLMEKNLEEEELEKESSLQLEWRLAGDDDLPDFRNFLPRFYITCFQKRFGENEHCLVATHKGEIVYFCWFTWDENYQPSEKDFWIGIGPEKAYIYDAYTRLSFRNQGIHQEAYRRIHKRLLDRGIKYSVIMMDKRNLNAILTAVQVGFKLKGTIFSRRILWNKKFWFVPS